MVNRKKHSKRGKTMITTMFKKRKWTGIIHATTFIFLCFSLSVLSSLSLLVVPHTAWSMGGDEVDRHVFCAETYYKLWSVPMRIGLPIVNTTVRIDGERVKLLPISNTDGVNCDPGENYYSLPSFPLTHWELERPAGSNAILSNDNTLMPSLNLDVPGEYTVRLFTCTPECNIDEPPTETFPEGRTITIPEQMTWIRFTAHENITLPPEREPIIASTEDPTNKSDFPHAQSTCFPPGTSEPGFTDPQWMRKEPWSGEWESESEEMNKYRLVEGEVFHSRVSRKDSPTNHESQDFNIYVKPDPPMNYLLKEGREFLDVEWERDHFPESYWPTPGDRVSIYGHWIFDCAHGNPTEIHPPVMVATHRPRPIRIPSNKLFDFNGTTSNAGTNVYVPGIVTDVWINQGSGEVTNCGWTSLYKPSPCYIPDDTDSYPEFCSTCDHTYCDEEDEYCEEDVYCRYRTCVTGPSPIRRYFQFNIYLPRSPHLMMAKIGRSAPPAPLYIGLFTSDGTPIDIDGDPTINITRQDNYFGTYLQVTINLLDNDSDRYGRRIEAGWVYPSSDNWGLERWRLHVDSIDVHDSGDGLVRGDGDWRFWINTNNVSKEWTRLFDCSSCIGDSLIGDNVVTYSQLLGPAPWSTGTEGVLGPDILRYPNYRDLYDWHSTGQRLWVHATGFEEDTLASDDSGTVGELFSPLYRGDYDFHIPNRCRSEYGTGLKEYFVYSGCTDYTLNYRLSFQEEAGSADLTTAAMKQYSSYTIRYSDYLLCSRLDSGKGPCVVLPPVMGMAWHPIDLRLTPDSQGRPRPVSVYNSRLFKPQEPDAEYFPYGDRGSIKTTFDHIAQYRPKVRDWLLNRMREKIQIQLPVLGVNEIEADLEWFNENIADVTPPVVTPPGNLTVYASEAGGARGSASTALAAFLSGGSATDSVDPAPVRLNPQVSGADVDNNTLFPIGTTIITFRFQDASGNIGYANANVTVVGKPGVSGKIISKAWKSPGILFVNLQLTNTGKGIGKNIKIKQVVPRTLSGTGTVTYNTTLSPGLPHTIGDLDVGASTTVGLYLNVPSMVTKFSITENGTVQDIVGTTLNYSTGQAVVP